jgi:hypothetical protein
VFHSNDDPLKLFRSKRNVQKEICSPTRWFPIELYTHNQKTKLGKNIGFPHAV